MTGILRSIVLGVSTAALFGGIAMTLIHAGALREIVRIAVGTMLILSLLYPISQIHIGLPFTRFQQSTEAVTQRVEQAQEQRKDWMAQSTAQEIGAYLVRKAKNEGIVCDIDVQASLHEDDTVSLDGVTVYASLTPEQIQWFENMLKDECGIPRERQAYVEN